MPEYDGVASFCFGACPVHFRIGAAMDTGAAFGMKTLDSLLWRAARIIHAGVNAMVWLLSRPMKEISMGVPAVMSQPSFGLCPLSLRLGAEVEPVQFRAG